MTRTNSTTPELDKMSKVIESGASDTLTGFYDWLTDKGYRICEYVDSGRESWDGPVHEFAPVHGGPEKLFAEFFKINLDKIETERRQIIKQYRAMS
jgi:hypothetical protein